MRLFAPALFVVAADQLTKYLIRGAITPDGFIPLIGSQVGLTHIVNTGASFGMLQGQNTILVIVAALMIAALFIWRKDLAPWKGGDILIGLILGGVLGNLIDRLWIGGVTDFLKIGPWPAFNVADSTLTLGILGLICITLLNERKMPKSKPSKN